MLELLEPISQWTGLEPSWVLAILAIGGFVFLRWGFRNPWGLLRVLMIVTLLGGAVYAAFELAKTGTAGKKAILRSRPVELPR